MSSLFLHVHLIIAISLLMLCFAENLPVLMDGPSIYSPRLNYFSPKRIIARYPKEIFNSHGRKPSHALQS